jgi:dienelactone hydrolase
MVAFMLGRTTIGERVVDVSTVIDAITEKFDFVDANRINLMGNSGGGTATFYAAAIDERIKIAVPSCAYCTYKDSIAAMPHCSCNFIPGILDYFEMEDISGLIAPRKLVVVNGKEDNIFPEPGVIESFEIIKKMYAAAGVPDNCALVTGAGGHRFYADDAWPVMHKMSEK